MTALPNAKSMLPSAIDTDNKPYADATATTQETVSQVSSSNFSSIDDDGELSLSSSRDGAVVMLHSRHRFLLSRTDECTGNGGPGLLDCTATAGRLGLGLLGLESDAFFLGSSAFLARDRDNQLFLSLGRQWVRANTACRTFDRLEFGDGHDCLVDGSCSRRRQQQDARRTSGILLAGARTRSFAASERISS